jgi:hypothetical protein
LTLLGVAVVEGWMTIESGQLFFLAIAGFVALNIALTLIFRNPFRDKEARKEEARRRWTARVQQAAREHTPYGS